MSFFPSRWQTLISSWRANKNHGQRTLLSDEDDQQSAWSVRMREREVRLVAAVGQLLFRLVDCTEVGRHRNKDEEVNEDETC
jgi:hypothetical protein